MGGGIYYQGVTTPRHHLPDRKWGEGKEETITGMLFPSTTLLPQGTPRARAWVTLTAGQEYVALLGHHIHLTNTFTKWMGTDQNGEDNDS